MAEPLTKEAIAAELIRRGVPASEIEAAGFPQVARQGSTGLIVPPLGAPDEVAARQAYGKDYGMLRDSREALGKFAPEAAQLERFQAANQRQPTGGIQHQEYQGWERANPLNWPGMIGNAVTRFDPEIQEMSGISSALQGKARPVGSGATSDFEQRLYRQGVPSPEKPGPVNDSIISYMRATTDEENDRLAFQEEFLRRNGSLAGSTQAWTRYVRDNPYASTTKEGRFAPNAKRPKWDEYFGVKPNARDLGRMAAEKAWAAKLGSPTKRNAAGVTFQQWWEGYAPTKYDASGKPRKAPKGGGKGWKVLSVE